MSEFECRCGELMLYDKKTHKITCPVCGGKKAGRMNGKSNRELRAEDEQERGRDEENDK